MKRIIILLALLLIPSAAYGMEGFPAFPMSFYGTVAADGSYLTAGNKVRAYCGSDLVGEATVASNGVYGSASVTGAKLLVKQNACSEIVFKYYDGKTEKSGLEKVSYSGAFSAGTAVNSNLSFKTKIEYTVAANSTEIPVNGNNTVTTTINVPLEYNSSTINISALTSVSGNTTMATLPGAIAIGAVTAIGNVDVAIPAGTVVTAGSATWNGVINLPQVKSNGSVSVTPDTNKNATVVTAVEIGLNDTLITFDKAVRIKIYGQAAKDVGWSRAGVFTKITNTCAADSQTAGDALATGSECKIDVGPDVIIWTKHFTTFITYTQTTVVNQQNTNDTSNGSASSNNVVNNSVITATNTPRTFDTGSTTLKAVIAPGTVRTAGNQITLSLNGGPNAIRVAISNTADFAGASQEFFANTKVWTLSAGTGPKTVYVKFYDYFGNASPVLTVAVGGIGSVVDSSKPVAKVLGEKITKLDALISTLKLNQSNAKVKELQEELKKLGYFSKNFVTTNFYGKMTGDAVKKYLAAKQMPVFAPKAAVVSKPVVAKTAVIPKPVSAAVAPVATASASLDDLIATLTPNRRDARVKDLQAQLKKLGFYPKLWVITDFYGATTIASVKKYQASK